VTEPAARARMTWTDGMPPGLFKGIGTFALTPERDPDQIRYAGGGRGLLLSMIWRSMPDLTASFEQFADGLKELASKTP
jgi:hypothetical protein